MKIAIESTSKMVVLKDSALADGVECRVWEGVSDTGIEILCLMANITTKLSHDINRLSVEFINHREPSGRTARLPRRMTP